MGGKEGWWRLWRALAKLERAQPEAALEDCAAALEDPDSAPRAHFAAALAERKLGRLDEAVRRVDAGLALAPDVEWAHRLRAMCRYERGERGVVDDCARALRLNEMVGTLFIPLGNYDKRVSEGENIAAADAAIEKDPKAYWAYVYRADFKRGPSFNDNASALADLKRAVELEPGCAWAWAFLARAHVVVGDFASGGAALARARKLDPDCGWIAAWHGEQLRRQGDLAGAAKSLDFAAERDADYELTYAWRGGVRVALGRCAAAVEDLDVAVGLKPTNIGWCYFERHAAKRRLGLASEALDDIEVAHRLNDRFVWENRPSHFAAALREPRRGAAPRPEVRAMRRLWRGEILIRSRRFKDAAAELSRAVRLDPALPEARILRGRALGESGQWPRALADFDAAVELDPRSPAAHAWRGRAAMLQGRPEEALGGFDRALALESTSAWVLAWKGEALFRLGRHEDAVRDLTKALEISARFADALLWRGAARLALGEDVAALHDLEESLAVAPGSAEALSYRDAARARLAAATGTGARIAELDRLHKAGEHAAAAALCDELLAAGAPAMEILAMLARRGAPLPRPPRPGVEGLDCALRQARAGPPRSAGPPRRRPPPPLGLPRAACAMRAAALRLAPQLRSTRGSCAPSASARSDCGSRPFPRPKTPSRPNRPGPGPRSCAPRSAAKAATSTALWPTPSGPRRSRPIPTRSPGGARSCARWDG